MPCQRILAPVTGAGPPQAAETVSHRSFPTGAGAGEIPVAM